jgi:hypothetical protein
MDSGFGVGKFIKKRKHMMSTKSSIGACKASHPSFHPCRKQCGAGELGVKPHKSALMEQPPNLESHEHDLTMHVFSVSAGMVGVCLTAIGLLRLVATQTQVQTLGDELLAVDAMLFVACAFLAFWSFKTNLPSTRRRLRLIVDTLFLVGLAGMGAICAVISYAIL